MRSSAASTACNRSIAEVWCVGVEVWGCVVAMGVKRVELWYASVRASGYDVSCYYRAQQWPRIQIVENGRKRVVRSQLSWIVRLEARKKRSRTTESPVADWIASDPRLASHSRIATSPHWRIVR
jgi:hypothetical protein